MGTRANDTGRDVADTVTQILAGGSDLAAAWIFGSVARGEARDDSDLDIAVLFVDPGADATTRRRDLASLALRLEAATGRTIDIVVFSEQPVVFRHRVLTEGIRVLDADPERRIDVESETYSRYFDFKPTWDVATAGNVRGMLNWLESRK